MKNMKITDVPKTARETLSFQRLLGLGKNVRLAKNIYAKVIEQKRLLVRISR